MTEKVNVPKLRFGEFEGEWNEVDISSLGKVVTGSTPPTSDPSNYLGDRLFISPADLDGRKYISSTKTTLSQKGFDTGRLLPSGSVCFVCIGSTIGKVAINSEDAISNQQINAVVVNHKKYDSDFVYSRLIKDSPRIKLLAGEQAVPILNKSSFGKVKVFTPPLHEQQKIASFLSKVDEKIALLTEKKDKLTEYKKGAMQQLFNGKWQEQDGQLTFIPPTLRFKADDGSEFPDWEEKKLGDLFSISAGGDISKEHSNSVKTDKFKYPVFANAETNKGLHSYSDIYKISQPCLTVSGRGSLGNAVFRDEPFYPIVRLLVLKAALPVDLKFYEYAINKLNIFNESTGVPQLTAPQLRTYAIVMPCIEEQKKIARAIESLDRKIDLVLLELEKAKEWKKGLLQQMFV
ncbi:restriction endonuclease subunit S [Vibrio vulnificus]|uniref:restriction endonuclease subunit S n=1 Tax=Vibrio vulnificus TaxID=672 RepID=UPI001CDBBF3C|nr:restriction endonuclease subunit S [Vibrio vulnificus]EGQ9293143.1 restriction endonuclease subunit S [Vibrio vulnificus]MCA4022552.1 restriction endonuclease subunit S [Vibrio vulnificus]